MSSDTVEPGWQRVLALWSSLWNSYSARRRAPITTDGRPAANAEPLAVWEDEGGAPAGHSGDVEKSPPGAPLDPAH
jgi:hypothetical protein